MSQYRYSPLSQSPGGPDRIRLLRLLPEEAEAGHEPAQIQCELFEYSLQDSGRSTHLYEALSYVWGNEINRRLIYVDGHELLVTENLYAALSHLRDHRLTRLLWIDAICIDQTNHPEKEDQIQLMSKIYGLAQRVIVWLGKATDSSDLAIKEIRAAGSNRRSSFSGDGTLQHAVIKLLQRPWFERIWVLQEVAAARHVLIMCGSTEIDGNEFCLGLDLFLFVDEYSSLQNMISSVTYLIREARFRPKYPNSGCGTSCLDIYPLGRLVDMYHTQRATDRRDKVFALLNMSSDDLSESGLSPNYDILWTALLERLVKFLLGSGVLVKTWIDWEIAVIESKGCVLGRVSSVEGVKENRQTVGIDFVNIPGQSRHLPIWNVRWALHTSARSIHPGDIVCRLEGASLPSIIRQYRESFVVIVITASPEETETDVEGSRVLELITSITSFFREFLLVWDWENDPEYSQFCIQYKTSDISRTGERKKSKAVFYSGLDKATRSSNVDRILHDLEDYEETKRRLWEAVEGCKNGFTEDHAHTLANMDSLAIRYQQRKKWKHAERLSLGVIDIRKHAQGEAHENTLESMQILVTSYEGQGLTVKAQRLKMMVVLLEKRKDGSWVTEEEIVNIGRYCDKEMMGLLFQWNVNGVHITENVLLAAVKNERHAKEILGLVLEQELLITEKVLEEAVWREKNVQGLLHLLLERGKGKPEITESVLVTVVINSRQDHNIIRIFLERNGADIQMAKALGIQMERRFGGNGRVSLLQREWDNPGIRNALLEEEAIANLEDD